MEFCLKLLCGITVSVLFIVCLADKYDVKDKHCDCIDNDCGCCTELDVEKVLNGRLCANFSYLPKDIGVSATVTYNNLAIFNETVSATNPPPICVIHFDKLEMEICLRLYNLNYTNCFSGCAEFEVHFFKVLPLKKLKLGCFGCRYSTYSRNEFLQFGQHEKHPEIVVV